MNVCKAKVKSEGSDRSYSTNQPQKDLGNLFKITNGKYKNPKQRPFLRGSRSLFYSRIGELVLVASDPRARFGTCAGEVRKEAYLPDSRPKVHFPNGDSSHMGCILIWDPLVNIIWVEIYAHQPLFTEFCTKRHSHVWWSM